MLDTRFIFIEGIMGAGKTTTAWWLARHLNRRRVRARFIPEGPTKRASPHPLRVATDLPHPRAVWRDVRVEEYAALSLQKWQRFVGQVEHQKTVTVCDGLLFHGNMTDLLLMGADRPTLHHYAAQIVARLGPLDPTVVYLRRADVAAALRAVCAERGAAWQSYQIDWKLSSPYALQRSLAGIDGLVRLYLDYRAICDEILAQLPISRLVIDNDGDWATYRRRILAFLDVRPPWWIRLLR